jgi:hypothetical protein
MIVETKVLNEDKVTVLETKVQVQEFLKLYSKAITELAPIVMETVQAITTAVEIANTPADPSNAQ